MDRRSKARVYNFMLRFCHCWSSCLSFLFSKSNVNNFFFNFFYVKTLSGPVSDPSKFPSGTMMVLNFIAVLAQMQGNLFISYNSCYGFIIRVVPVASTMSSEF